MTQKKDMTYAAWVAEVNHHSQRIAGVDVTDEDFYQPDLQDMYDMYLFPRQAAITMLHNHRWLTDSDRDRLEKEMWK